MPPPPHPAHRRGPPVQGGVAAQDALVEPGEAGAGFDPQLLDEGVPEPAVDPQGVGAPAGAVEGHHEMPVQGLPQRMLVGEGQQFPGEFLVVAEAEIGDDPLFQDLHAQLVQADRGGFEAHAVRDAGERGAGPERQCLVQQPGRPGEVAFLVGGAAVVPQPFEARQVERVLLVGDLEQIPGRAGQQQPAGGFGALGGSVGAVLVLGEDLP